MGYFLYGLVAVLYIISFFTNKNKTKKAAAIGVKTMNKLLITIIPMLFLIGVVIALLQPEIISSVLGEKSGFMGILIALGVGSIGQMPPFVAFPFGIALLSNGAAYPQIAAFVSSLMAVGVVSLGVETSYFGQKFAVARNVSALIIAGIFSMIIWVVM